MLNVMWQAAWEGSLGENGYMYTYDSVPLLFTCNHDNAVNQLYPKIKSLKKKRAENPQKRRWYLRCIQNTEKN